VRDAAPGRVLRLSLVAWGLGELAMGRRYLGSTWLLAEAVGLALIGLLTWLLRDTTWYLAPFVLGMAFIAAWAFQAVAAYRRAERLASQATRPAPRSPAAVAAWLTLPLLAWGTGFWLIAADHSSPAAVVNRFLGSWADATDGRLAAWDQPSLAVAAADATSDLRTLCAQGILPADCSDSPPNLLRGIRFRIVASAEDRAVAVAEVVRFERHPTRVLGLFDATELTPVTLQEILRLDLVAEPAAIDSRRWTIVNASVP
jgi:hypothetical protein